MEVEDLTYSQLKGLLQDALQAFQNASPNIRKDEYTILGSIIRNIDFFQTNLEAPANLHDFSQMIKYHLGYEVHPKGTALMKEGEYANKFYVLLKGSVQKLKPRTFEDLEEEVKEQSPKKRKIMKKQATEVPVEYMTPPVKKDLPRYLQHTVATQKKTSAVKLEYYVSPLTLLNDTAETKPKFVRQNSRVEKKKGPSRKQSFEPSSDGIVADETQKIQDQTPTNMNLNSFMSSNNQSQSYVVMNVRDGSRSPSPEQKESILNRMNSSQMSVKELAEKEETEEEEEFEEEDEEEEDEEDNDEDDETDSQVRKKKKARLLKNGMTEDDVNFIKFVAKQNPDIENRCFLGEIIRVKKDQSLKIGGYFGDNFFRRNRPKEDCIMAVASEEAHFLILTREKYDMVMAEIQKQSQEKAKFFIDLFPFYDDMIVKKFSYHFSERDFKKNDAVFHQGTPASELFILRTGDVRLFKEVDESPREKELDQSMSNSILVSLKCSGKVGLPIATVMKNQFFGDELFLKQETRKYTAIAIGTASTYFLKDRVYHKIKSYFSDLLQILKDHTKERFVHRELRVNELLDRKKQNTEKILSRKWSDDRLGSKAALKAHLGVRWGKDQMEDKRKNTPELRSGYKSPDSHNQSNTDLKTSRTEASVPVPTTLDENRIDFSRNARIMDNMLDGRFIRRKVDDRIREASRSPPKHNTEEFNMVKELLPKDKRLRLPAIMSTSRSPSPQKGLHTDRSGIITRPTEPDMSNSPLTDKRFSSKRSQSIETLTMDFIYDDLDDDERKRYIEIRRAKESKAAAKLIHLEQLKMIPKRSAQSIIAKAEFNNKIRKCVQTIVDTNKVLKATGPTALKLAIQGKRKIDEEVSSPEAMKLSAVLGKRGEIQIKTHR